MPINILMPALSPTMEEGKLAKWLKAEGDTVAAGDIIAEIETDKATMEVEAVDEGTLGKIMVADGTDGVKVNEVIAVLLEEGEDASAIGAAPAAAPAPAAEVPAEAPATATAPAAAAPAPTAPVAPSGNRVFASPLARRIAAEKGLDLAQVTGSGPHGRIVKADVEGEAAAPAPAPATAAAAAAPMVPAGPSTEMVRKMYADREHEEIELDGMRKTIAARLMRGQMNARAQTRGIKLSVNDYIIKASALALQQVPGCNAVWAGDRVLQFKASDVAVAVAIEGGLFTPVLRDADTKSLSVLSAEMKDLAGRATKSLSVLSAEMKDLAGRARERKLAPHEYQGGSFAISNLGMMGIENFDAVINPPHASILAVGAGVQQPVVKDGAVAIATVMSVTLSVDHRVIDGALGAQFLDAFKGYMEDPLSMLM
jgi:pyruvate dehydrogenase E2 component (dihydrolipoamide acetyltransferase)